MFFRVCSVEKIAQNAEKAAINQPKTLWSTAIFEGAKGLFQACSAGLLGRPNSAERGKANN